MSDTPATPCVHTGGNVCCEHHHHHHKGEPEMTHLPHRTVTITARGEYCRRTGEVTGALHHGTTDWIMVAIDGREVGFKAGELA